MRAVAVCVLVGWTWMFFAPISRQSSRTCRRQNGLPKSFEDARDGCESRLCRVHTAQQLFQLGHDAALFVKWCERNHNLFQISPANSLPRCANCNSLSLIQNIMRVAQIHHER